MTNLVISQIHYNPDGQSETTEFIEVMNVSGGEIELAGTEFTEGILFDFSTAADTTLDVGERAVVVKDLTAFNMAYAAFLPLHILGVYSGSLDNGGERLRLQDAFGGTIRDFSYNDKSPWPESPDGDGPSLVLIDPTGVPIPDHSVGTNWRPSAVVAGSPGTDDSVDYASWKTANGVPNLGGAEDFLDDDGDEIVVFLEYAFGGNPNVAEITDILPTAQVEPVDVSGVIDDYLTIRFNRVIGADDLTYTPEVSTDLAVWNSGPAFLVEVDSPVYNPKGTETVTFRTLMPVVGDDRRFIRASVTR